MIDVGTQQRAWIEIPDASGMMRTGGLRPHRFAFPIEIRRRRARVAEVVVLMAVLLAAAVASYAANDAGSVLLIAMIFSAVAAAYYRLYTLGRWPRDVGDLVAKIDQDGFYRNAGNGPELLFKWTEVRRAGRVPRGEGSEFLVELSRPIHGVKRPSVENFWETAQETELALSTDGFMPEERELQLIVERMITDAGGRIVRVWW